MNSAVEDDGGFDSPEDGASAQWTDSPGAHARIISTEVIGDRAEVVMEVGEDSPYSDYVYFVRRHSSWYEAVSGSGPTHRWWDPTEYDW